MASQFQTGTDPHGRARRTPTGGGRGRGTDPSSGRDGADGTAPAQGQYLTFPIASEVYAVSVLEASEVLEYRAPTPVPGAPAWVPGMLSLRGRPVPMMDLAAKFGGAGCRPGASSCIVILDLVVDEEPSQIGILVDDMPAVVQLDAEQIAEPPRFGTLVDVRYLRGMARLDSGLVLLLDAAGALTAEEAALLATLEEQAEEHAAARTEGDEVEGHRGRDTER